MNFLSLNLLPNAPEMKNILQKKFHEERSAFLDSLQPDDFRNGASFNSSAEIIDQLNNAFLQRAKNCQDQDEFMQKALDHLFRDNSSAKEKAFNLAKSYLDLFK